MLLIICISYWLADCFDPLDPNGNITITFDIKQWTREGYVVSMSFIITSAKVQWNNMSCSSERKRISIWESSNTLGNHTFATVVAFRHSRISLHLYSWFTIWLCRIFFFLDKFVKIHSSRAETCYKQQRELYIKLLQHSTVNNAQHLTLYKNWIKKFPRTT